MSQDQEKTTQAIRISLINTACQNYTALINFLKSSPFDQNTIGFQQAYINLDQGMLWIKEMMFNLPLLLPREENIEPLEFDPVTPD